MVKKFDIDKSLVDDFNSYKIKLESLKAIINSLDKYSMAFRYPIDNKGNYYFSENVDIDIEEIIDLLYYVNKMFLGLDSNIYTRSNLYMAESMDEYYNATMKESMNPR